MHARELAERYPLLAAAPGTCRVCGCTADRACHLPEFGPCWWIEPNLCSYCAEPAIVVALFADMQRRLEAGQTFARFEIDGWSRRAYSALRRASTSPPTLFEL